MSPWMCMASDVFRVYGRSNGLILLRGFLARRTLRPLITMRLCQWARSSSIGFLISPLARLLHKAACQIACVDLPWSLNAGPGLAITHGWGLVVSPGCTIGANVTLFHGVTLGRRDKIDAAGNRHTGYPVIEDEVWIGPHAVIVGGIRIGRGSRIAGGAFVTEDIPPHCTVVGNPAAIVRRNSSPDVFNRAPVDTRAKVTE